MKIDLIAPDVRNVITQLETLAKSGVRQLDSSSSVQDIVARAAEVGATWSRERERLMPVLNAGTNTISADLKRVAVAQETVRAFAKRVLPLRLFSSIFAANPLQGTDELAVPYFPLQAGASVDFNPANGYVFAGSTNTESKKITLNKRKYQPFDFSSEEFRRQPFLDAMRLSFMNGEKLAYDVLMDVLSVVTLANFGAAAVTKAENAYTSDDVADLRGVANTANWPDIGRSLIVNGAVDLALSKDASYKAANVLGTPSVIQQGKFPQVSGFDLATMQGLPENGEKLVGMIAYASAILAAFAPVAPTEEVRHQLKAFGIMIDGDTGIALAYRRWGSADFDRSREIIECSYGYAVGEAAALKRLTKP